MARLTRRRTHNPGPTPGITKIQQKAKKPYRTKEQKKSDRRAEREFHAVIVLNLPPTLRKDPLARRALRSIAFTTPVFYDGVSKAEIVYKLPVAFRTMTVPVSITPNL